MAHNKRKRLPLRRRREGKTDYRRRLRYLKSGDPRAVVRVSLKNSTVQFIDFDPTGDRVLASATGKDLRELGWKYNCANLPAAYLTGLLAGKRAAQNNVDRAILDIGLKVPSKGSKVFASLKGMIDAGIDIPHGEQQFPSDERIEGAHIDGSVPNDFNKIKERILGGTSND